MELRIFTEPQQGATYDQLVRIAKASEDLGFGAFFRSDHYLVDERRRAARSDGRVDDAGRDRSRDQHHQARHADDLGDVPAPGTAGDPGGAGRPDERRPGRARARRGLVRAGARGVRHPVPGHARALRPVRGAARRDHRPVGDRGGGAVLARGRALLAHRLPGPAQAGPATGPAGADRRPGQAAYAGAGRPLRRRVQPAVRLRGGHRDAVRPGPRRRARRSAGTPTSSPTPTRWCCAAVPPTRTYAAAPR